MNIHDKINRVDGISKINGSAKYIEDIHLDEVFHARTLRSGIAKGRVKSIDYPVGYEDIIVVDSHDIHKNEVLMITTDMPVFTPSEVTYVGEPLSLILGKDKHRVIEFMNQIKIVYEEDEGIFAMDACTKAEDIFSEYVYEKGNIHELEYDEIFEKVYETGYQEQLYMEKQGMIASYDDHILTIQGSMQCPYYIKNALIHATGLPDHRIRVIQTTTGGAFGGKEEYPSLLACQLAAAAMKVRQTVSLIFDRREDILTTTKRHPSRTTIKSYLKDDKILGMDILYEIDGGSYRGLTDVVLQRGLLTLTGCYKIDHVQVKGKAYRTNNIFSGAFRGFGAPQSMFALEQHMNQLAKKFKEDPISYRRKYFVQQGDLSATSGVFHEKILLNQMADALIRLSEYDDLLAKKEKNMGIGVSFVPHGGGFTGDGEAAHIKAQVKLKKDTLNRVHLLVSTVEMGQGAKTVLSKIVASTLEIPIEQIVYDDPDTFKVPDSGPTVASRTTMVVGGLLYKAALELKPLMNNPAEIVITKNYVHPEEIVWNQKSLKGNAYLAYSWSAVVAVVYVDPITWEIDCQKLYGIYDVGVPVDEKTLLGQVHGGVAQGLGYGMMEKMESEQGILQHNSFSSYAVPVMADMPKMEVDWIFNPYREGPYGAKAAGELTLVGVAPAIAAAVEDATGFDLCRLPIMPEDLVKEAEK